MRAQHPPWSVLARRFRTYLKYICSRANKTAANRMPDMSSRKADKNCSRARGSLDLCSCFPGLHVPVIQYRRNLSRSPVIRIPIFLSAVHNIVFQHPATLVNDLICRRGSEGEISYHACRLWVTFLLIILEISDTIAHQQPMSTRRNHTFKTDPEN